MSLTAGAIRRLKSAEGQSSDPSFQPQVQIIHLRSVVGSGGSAAATERFRAIISDGEHFVQGMLATQLNHLVHQKQILDNSVIRVRDFMNNSVQGRTVIILLGIEVVTSNPGRKFGNPKDIENDPSANRPATGAARPAAGPAAAAGAQPMYGRTSAAPTHNPNRSMYGAPTNSYNAAAPKPQGAGGYGGGNPKPYGTASNRYGSSSSTSAPIVRSSNLSASGQPITPISALNMYQNRWTIRARVTTKTDIRHWQNAKGEGSLFSVELLDSSGTDIRATFFREAVDKFYNILEVDKVFTFSGGRLKIGNIQYNTCKSQFEITFDQNAEIHLDADSGDIQQQLYEFVPIAQLESVDPGKSVDILSIVKSIGAVGTIVSKKTGSELTKCELVLIDESNVEVNLTVWGDRANRASTEFANSPVVAFRRARVSDFGGRSLSTSVNGAVTVNPRIPEVDRLRSWWSQNSSSASSRSLSGSGSSGAGRIAAFAERKTISAIKSENLGHTNPDKPDWISFKATFNFLKKDKDGGAWYTACANSGEPCRNRFKVTQTTDGHWFCEKCQQTYEKCVRRFIFSATVTDDSSTTWVSIFNEQAELMLAGATADQVYAETHGDNYDQDKYDSYFAMANFTDWVMTCRVKMEQVGDENRVKANVYSLHPVDYAKESRELLGAIMAM